VVGVRLLTIVVVENVSSLVAIVARGQPGDDATFRVTGCPRWRKKGLAAE
jgi:hypothetical protein